MYRTVLLEAKSYQIRLAQSAMDGVPSAVAQLSLLNACSLSDCISHTLNYCINTSLHHCFVRSLQHCIITLFDRSLHNYIFASLDHYIIAQPCHAMQWYVGRWCFRMATSLETHHQFWRYVHLGAGSKLTYLGHRRVAGNSVSLQRTRLSFPSPNCTRPRLHKVACGQPCVLYGFAA